MTSTISGNILGTVYFLYFQLAGIVISSYLLKKEKLFTKIIMGLTVGAALLYSLPCIFSFFFDFTIKSHIWAATVLMPVVVLCAKNVSLADFSDKKPYSEFKKNIPAILLFTATFVLWCYLLHTHIILPVENNGLHCGQCTYGDMCMHLGFISSIATQGTFPPHYSIFPVTKLAYPFLNATISSSVYIWGASLRLAYILPMLTAFIQIMGSIYLLAETILSSRAKSLFTFILYMFNGGLGFIYFTGLMPNCQLTFSDIFTGYYTTPTNLIDFNIRWANVIADIFLPQRASLFGYALLFPCLWLLHQAVWADKKKYFVLAGILGGLLPLVHTHSFLAIVIISAAWLLIYLYRNTNQIQRWYGLPVFIVFITAMCVIQQINNRLALPSSILMIIGVSGILCCIFYGCILLYKYIPIHGYKKLLAGWGIYLVLAAAIAIPQLAFWTFGQVSDGGFLRGHFNWGNLGDFYPWFYIKNIGFPLFFIVGAIWKGSKKCSHLILPAGVIWFIAEFIMFTPNTYDNNKLLYVAYLLLCIAGADFAIDLYDQIKNISLRRFATVVALFLCVFSAVLTLGREAVSDYQVISQTHLEAAEYIINHTAPDAVIMTNTRHNNEVAALTGRNIVCGSDIYLYFHGIDTNQRKTDLSLMYSKPDENIHLFEKYNVAYVMISSWERNSYVVDEAYFRNNCEKVFNCGDIDLYKL